MPQMFTLTGTISEPSIIRRIPAATVSAGEFFQRTCLVHVTTASVSVVEGGQSATALTSDEPL